MLPTSYTKDLASLCRGNMPARAMIVEQYCKVCMNVSFFNVSCILYLVFLITIMIIMMSRAGLDLHIACS